MGSRRRLEGVFDRLPPQARYSLILKILTILCLFITKTHKRE
jgi:hypothetical protein